MRTGRKFTYSPSFLRSATLMLGCSPPMGVAVGPFRPTRVHSSEANTSSGSNCPRSSSAFAPASTRSQLLAQRHVDARVPAADGRGRRTLQAHARALQRGEHVVRRSEEHTSELQSLR